MRNGAWPAQGPHQEGLAEVAGVSIQSEIRTIRWSNAKCKLLPGANYRKACGNEKRIAGAEGEREGEGEGKCGNMHTAG